MKKFQLLIFPLMVAVMMSGCEYFLPDSDSNPVENPVQFVEEVDLQYGQRISLDEGRLTLFFSKVIDDSRCPYRALCATSGNAQIEILTATLRFSGASVLNTNIEDVVKYPHKDTFAGYEIELVELQPKNIVRHNSVPHKDYTARLAIRKK